MKCLLRTCSVLFLVSLSIQYNPATQYLTSVNLEKALSKDKSTKIPLDKTLTYAYPTSINESGLEILTGLNVFKQDDKDLEFELRLDYDQILLPGASAVKKVTCNAADGCAKGEKAQELNYFGKTIKQAYPTNTYLNIGKVNSVADFGTNPKASAYIIDSDMTTGGLGLGFANQLY